MKITKKNVLNAGYAGLPTSTKKKLKIGKFNKR